MGDKARHRLEIRPPIRHTTTVAQHVIIDGNNLLHAMHEHAPIPHVGRETLVKIIERSLEKQADHRFPNMGEMIEALSKGG